MEQDYEYMLAELTKRVHHLEKEVERLGGTVYKPSNQAVVQQQETVKVQKEELPKATTPPVRTTPPMNNAIPVRAASQSINSRPVEVKKANDKTFENKIGKNFMAVIASILIFCSLVLFAGIAFKYLSDYAKTGIMMAVSLAISAFGLIKMRKLKRLSEEDPDNASLKYKTFFTALSGCGIGATYITCLVGYFVFEIYGIVLLATVIGLWLVVTMYLGYRFSDIFVYICNAGLIVSALLLSYKFENSVIGLICYTVCLIALYAIRHKENYNHDLFYFIQYPVILMILASIGDSNLIFSYTSLLLLGVTLGFSLVLYRLKEEHLPTNLVSLFLNLLAMYIIYDKDYTSSQLLIYMILVEVIGIGVIYYIKYKKSMPSLFYVSYGVSVIFSLIMMSKTDLNDYISFTPYIFLLVLGFVAKDIYIRIGGYVALFFSYLYLMTEVTEYNEYVVSAGFLVLILVTIAAMILRDYKIADKYIVTSLVATLLYELVEEANVEGWICFIIATVICIFMNTKYYRINLMTKDEEVSPRIVGFVLNGLMMLYGIYSIAEFSNDVELYKVILITLATIALFCINTKSIYKTHIPEMLVGIYICFKFTVLVYVIMDRLSAESFVISIVGILLALACIVIGFVAKQKAFRLYGLILSLLCVIKLILFDLQYDSDILRPVGFFVAGILCFAISFVYSKLEKNMKQEEEKIEQQ